MAWKYENRKLRMENELLRDFLRSIEKEVRPKVKYTGNKESIPYPSCANSLAYPAASTMILSTVGTGLGERKDWQTSLPGSASGAGGIYGYRRMWLWMKSQNIHKALKLYFAS